MKIRLFWPLVVVVPVFLPVLVQVLALLFLWLPFAHGRQCRPVPRIRLNRIRHTCGSACHRLSADT